MISITCFVLVALAILLVAVILYVYASKENTTRDH